MVKVVKDPDFQTMTGRDTAMKATKAAKRRARKDRREGRTKTRH